TASRGAVACFGLALAVGWLLVAGSSYLWVKTWRAHMVQLADDLDKSAHVEVSGRIFDRGRRRDGFKRAYRRHHRLSDPLEFFSLSARLIAGVGSSVASLRPGMSLSSPVQLSGARGQAPARSRCAQAPCSPGPVAPAVAMDMAGRAWLAVMV